MAKENVLAVDLKVLNEAERDNVPAQVRVLDLGESRKDLFRRDCRLSLNPPIRAPSSVRVVSQNDLLSRVL